MGAWLGWGWEAALLAAPTHPIPAAAAHSHCSGSALAGASAWDTALPCHMVVTLSSSSLPGEGVMSHPLSISPGPPLTFPALSAALWPVLRRVTPWHHIRNLLMC